MRVAALSFRDVSTISSRPAAPTYRRSRSTGRCAHALACKSARRSEARRRSSPPTRGSLRYRNCRVPCRNLAIDCQRGQTRASSPSRVVRCTVRPLFMSYGSTRCMVPVLSQTSRSPIFHSCQYTKRVCVAAHSISRLMSARPSSSGNPSTWDA